MPYYKTIKVNTSGPSKINWLIVTNKQKMNVVKTSVVSDLTFFEYI